MLEDRYNGGFVKGSMTQDNMLILLGCIQSQMAKGETLYVAFVDFKKAFNYVNRTILFYKLIKSGFSGRTIQVLRDMYSKIKARVKVNNLLYDWIFDSSGTNQGGPLSPGMFRKLLQDLIAFLDLTEGIVINGSEVIAHLLWADNLILMSDNRKGLEKSLDGLFQFYTNSLKNQDSYLWKN